METQLFHKKDKLLDQIALIHGAMDSILYESKTIERDIHTEFMGIIERLGLAEGKSISILQQEITSL